MLHGSAPKSILRERRSCLRVSCAADCGSPRRYLSVPAIWHPCLHSSRRDIRAFRCIRATLTVSSISSAKDFDCAIRVGFLSDSNLIARRIGPIHGKLVASPEYVRENGAPETPDQLLAHQCLVQGTETWHFVDGDKTIALHPQGQFQADNGIALAAAAVAGLGIAALPNFLTEKEIASGALVALMKSYPLPEAGLFIVRPPGHHPARKVRVLTELLIEHFG